MNGVRNEVAAAGKATAKLFVTEKNYGGCEALGVLPLARRRSALQRVKRG